MVRNANIRAYEALYTSIDNDSICVYCGDYADTIDHFVPISKAEKVTDGFVLLPACFDCNVSANDVLVATVAEKRFFIHNVLRKRHRKLFAFPDWTEKEIGEMGWTMQAMIRKRQAQKVALLIRLAWNDQKNSAYALIAEVNSKYEDFGRSSAPIPVVKHGIRKSEMTLSQLGVIKRWKKVDRLFCERLEEDFGKEKAMGILLAIKIPEEPICKAYLIAERRALNIEKREAKYVKQDRERLDQLSDSF